MTLSPVQCYRRDRPAFEPFYRECVEPCHADENETSRALVGLASGSLTCPV
jgi:hypothetical protein